VNIQIRKGKEADLFEVHQLIKELAAFENAADEVETTVETMKNDAFSESPLFDFLVAESEGKVIGTAVYYYAYSTWKGKVLYLEDIVINELYRRKGIGSLLFDELIAIAKYEKVKRMSWQVLEWNSPAIDFYKKINSSFDAEWINCKLTFQQLQNRTK
jgi:GNAT superfamily N-acetyltransferase